jgi:aryl-alcohol dehydrogenase-like predicted oxidoreductase
MFLQYVERGLGEKVSKTDQLATIASEIGCTLGQLAIAWCTSNDKVSTVILGASRLSQLDENIDALKFVEKITPEIRARIDAIVDLQYKLPPAEPHLRAMREKWL